MTPRKADPPEDDIPPLDDAADFPIARRQAALHSRRDTVAKMRQVKAEIDASLQAERNRMRFVDEPRRHRD